ncbi:MAG: hypothetical protein LBK01_09525 [Burkholderiaceae bacterium]|jgi:hypothetical protein|nr:hypothetical protein [Burkholderiaceae bacterium]
MTRKIIAPILLGVLMIAVNPSFAGEGREDVEVGLIWNDADAKSECKKAQDDYPKTHADVAQARWTGQWKITGEGNKLIFVCGIRYITRSDWQGKPIDNRSVAENEEIKGCTKENGITNGWINDDKCRDRLVMNASELDRTIIVDDKDKITKAASSRYIFVLRKNDNQLVLRRYDRSYSLSTGGYDWCDNDAYLYAPNKKTIKDKNNRHVRHSQVNGSQGESNAWKPIWSAGELWIDRGKIIAISNESGHFKPSAKSLQYVKETLSYLSIPAGDIPLYDAINSSDKRKLDVLKEKCLGGTKKDHDL